MLFTPKQVARLQTAVRVVLVFGIVASMAANVLHAIVAANPDTPEWQIWARSVLSALAPVALFTCLEFVIRIPIQSRALGSVRLLVTLAIGGFAGWVSYWHMQGLCAMIGETGSAGYLYPLMIDGMMAVGTISLIELGRLARNVDAVVRQQAEVEQAIADAEAEAARAEARTARQIDDDETEARRIVGYDKLSGPDKGRFTRTYRSEGADAAVRLFGRRLRRTTTQQLPAAAPSSPGMPPVWAPSVDEVAKVAA